MQTRKSEKSNVELPAFRITGTDPVSRKHRKFFMVIWLVAASVLPAVRAQEANNSEPEQASATKTVVNAAPAAPTVRTASGIVRGVTEDDVSSFKRIPFAAPPVGENRWRPPQPFPAWEGERDASKFGADCAQAAFRPGTISIPSRHHFDVADFVRRLPVCQSVAPRERRLGRETAGDGLDLRGWVHGRLERRAQHVGDPVR